MNQLAEQTICCPYCGENIDILIDPSIAEQQQYIEDCQVCCRPIVMAITIGFDGELVLTAHDENESF